MIYSRYPVTRGMVTYAILWPSGNLLQQALDGSREWWDLREAARYGLYGSLVTAPLLHHWLQLLTRLLPGSSLSQALTKVCVRERERERERTFFSLINYK